jgi:hypothetical protein
MHGVYLALASPSVLLGIHDQMEIPCVRILAQHLSVYLTWTHPAGLGDNAVESFPREVHIFPENKYKV